MTIAWEILTYDLQVLAAPADQQLAVLPGWQRNGTWYPDWSDIALEDADVWMDVLRNHGRLTSEQESAVRQIVRLLMSLSASQWSVEGLRSSAGWSEARRLAQDALAAFSCVVIDPRTYGGRPNEVVLVSATDRDEG